MRASLLAVFAIEAGDFARGFAIGGALFQIGAFIPRNFSLGNTELGFQLAIFPMQIENDKSASADLGFAIEFIDLGAVEQKFADSFRGGNFMTCAFVGLDVGVVEESFTILNPGEGIADVGLAGTDRFDLAALELDAGFVALENVKVAQRFTVQNRLGSHDRATSAKNQAPSVDALCSSKVSLPAMISLRAISVREARGPTSTIGRCPSPS